MRARGGCIGICAVCLAPPVTFLQQALNSSNSSSSSTVAATVFAALHLLKSVGVQQAWQYAHESVLAVHA